MKTKAEAKAPSKSASAPVLEKQPERLEQQSGPAPGARPAAAARAADVMRASEQPSSAPSRARMMQGMQGSVGNARLSRMLGAPVRAKLAVGAPGDSSEQEADRVADSVMRMPEPRSGQEAGERAAQRPAMPVPLAGSAPQRKIQLSPLSNELELLWSTGDKGAFFNRLRNLGQSDPDVLAFIDNNLRGDDQWLARNLFLYSSEAHWPIHLRVEREMKGWSDSGGKAAVFNILRAAGGAEASNSDLAASLKRLFAAGSEDLWLAQNLQAYGPETNWPMNVLIPAASADRVEFTAGHALTAYGADPRANPIWTPGSADHAAAYTKTHNPVLTATFNVGPNLSRANIPSVAVRVSEGGAVRGTVAGISPVSDRIQVAGLALTGLTGSTTVGASNYNLIWEVSLNGATWAPLATTGPHPVYWVHATPLAAPLYNLAVFKAIGYASGAANVSAAIRSGLRGEINYSPSDPINSDPITVFADGVAICTDFANLLTLLARSVGLNANTVMFWGGFQSLGKNIWAVLGGMYGLINLVNVRSPNPAFNTPLPPISPSGWAFNYHAISRIEGTLHDAALDRVGIDAQAAHAGKIVNLVELRSSALPDAKRGQPYSQRIRRKNHSVGVTVRDYGPRITQATFGDVYAITIPPAAPSPFEIPVIWSMIGGTLPPGVTLNPAIGAINGTPTTDGTFTAQISITAPPGPAVLTHTSPLTLIVKP